jgi:hypothetical protein
LFFGAIRRSLVRGPLTYGIEVVVARAEAQFVGERGKEIKYSPGDDHHVVNGDEGDHHQSAVAEPVENRRHAGKSLVRSEAGVLTDDQFQEEDGHAHQEQHDAVGQEESAWK